MDKILESFQLPMLLRNFFAGFFFIFSYKIASSEEMNFDSANFLSVWPLLSLAVGIAIYNLHRAIVFPFIEWFFASNSYKEYIVKAIPLISKNAIEDLISRWNAKAESKQEVSEKSQRVNPCEARHLSAWADSIHFLYTSAICIIVGLLFKKIMGFINHHSRHLYFYHRHGLHHCCLIVCLLFLTSLLFFIGGFISNWRSRAVEEFIKKIPTEKNCHS